MMNDTNAARLHDVGALVSPDSCIS